LMIVTLAAIPLIFIFKKPPGAGSAGPSVVME
jgi:hypothetical protein